MQKQRRLWDAYRFPGFRPRATVHGIFGDPKARVVHLERRLRSYHPRLIQPQLAQTVFSPADGFATWGVETIESTWLSKYVGSNVRGAAK
jgi:hypothetical protein